MDRLADAARDAERRALVQGRCGPSRYELEDGPELDAGTREPADGTNPSGLPWSELDEVSRRTVVDAHRARAAEASASNSALSSISEI